MKNNYKQLSRSPSEPSISGLKRSASHALRSSFRLPKKRSNSQLRPLNCESLPLYVPPKAAAILQIDLSSTALAVKLNCKSEENFVAQYVEPIKIATIRKRSVWANSAAKISLPSHHNDDLKQKLGDNMHIGGFNFTKGFQQPKAESPEAMDPAKDILKEHNKNSSLDHLKITKKHKQGHVNKHLELTSQDELFADIENDNLDKLKILLDTNEVSVHHINNDGFSTLDIAILLNHREIAKVLLYHGAQVGPHSTEKFGHYIECLLENYERKLTLMTENAGSSLEIERHKIILQHKVKMFRRLLNGWARLQVPDSPFSFTIDVVGSNSVMLKILEPTENSICTKFRVQWSSRDDFSIIIGEEEISRWNIFQGTMGVNFQVNDLIQGRRYFFRACSGNLKGFGDYRNASPTSLIPSSWRDVEDEDKEHRFVRQKILFNELLQNELLTKPDDALENQENFIRRHNKKKTTIKHLFSTTTKFHKSLRRGAYLAACIIYNDDKILVTNEDFIPVIEIDEAYPNNLNNDFYWLMKISTIWDKVKALKSEMDKITIGSGNSVFRSKLLTAIYQMQEALGIVDLGQFYHKALKDSNGTIVLSCTLKLKDFKTPILNAKWITLSKLQKKVTVMVEDSSINEILLHSIHDQINFYHTSQQKLSRGLYLGYLKIYSSLDTIQVVCQTKTPNVLPNCKIRDNPHISAEEWSILKSTDITKAKFPLFYESEKSPDPSEAQQNFLESLKLSINRLFKFMNVDPKTIRNHQIFDLEVIEINTDVSFLVICPPSENSIITKDQTDLLLKRVDLMCLPLIAHEMIHFRTYQHDIIQKYSQLSCTVEIDTIMASHKHREAFSNSEIHETKEKLEKLQEIMNDLNASWKGVRWIMDIISYSRSKENKSESDMSRILNFKSNSMNHFLDPPIRNVYTKSPMRGSWSGTALMKTNDVIMYGEHSKSEQLLLMNGISEMRNSYLGSRATSGDSNYYSSGEQNDFAIPRLPPSKSEDTLVVIRKKATGNSHQRKRATALNLSTSSDTESKSSKTTSLIVNHQPLNAQSYNEMHSHDVTKVDKSANKSKLRVSHHPKSVFTKDNKSFEKPFESNEESTLVTFLKPTLNAIQNETHNRSFQDPLLIVEDEAIEMISSPFRKAPVEHKSKSSNQNFGNNTQFIRSNVHIQNVQSICQDPEIESADWRTDDFSKQTQNSDEKSSQAAPTKSNFQIEESLMEHLSSSNELSSSILQIFAAYDTGLAYGTSLKLKCHEKTTAQEVVELVVKQLNMAVLMKGKEGPIYDAKQLEDFCLVAVIGARERCLRPDFRPLQLQNPWKKGKLFVRLKHDLLAAIDTSNREAFSI